MFTPNQKVMIRRLGDDKEYRGRVVGIHSTHATCSFYIIEMIDRINNSVWSHVVMTTSCIDPEEWEEDIDIQNADPLPDDIWEEMNRVFGG